MSYLDDLFENILAMNRKVLGLIVEIAITVQPHFGAFQGCHSRKFEGLPYYNSIE
jgi:hypothetical protein